MSISVCPAMNPYSDRWLSNCRERRVSARDTRGRSVARQHHEAQASRTVASLPSPISRHNVQCVSRPRVDTHNTRVSHLGGDGRELEGLQGLVVDAGAGVDVDHHAGAAAAAEVALQHAGQLALPEGHHLGGPRPGGGEGGGGGR